MVGFLLPFSSPLMYCWLKPEISASCSCVEPVFSPILRAFRPTSLRAPCAGQRITDLVIDLPEPSAAGGSKSRDAI